jgi:hypothetical protein
VIPIIEMEHLLSMMAKLFMTSVKTIFKFNELVMNTKNSSINLKSASNAS